jgi:hypothetical protein
MLGLNPNTAAPIYHVAQGVIATGLMGQAVEAEYRLSSQPTQAMGRTELGRHQEGVGQFTVYYF